MMKLKFAPAQKIYYKKVFFASSYYSHLQCVWVKNWSRDWEL